MEYDIVIAVSFVVALVLLDLAALRFGVDTRPGPRDGPDW